MELWKEEFDVDEYAERCAMTLKSVARSVKTHLERRVVTVSAAMSDVSIVDCCWLTGHYVLPSSSSLSPSSPATSSAHLRLGSSGGAGGSGGAGFLSGTNIPNTSYTVCMLSTGAVSLLNVNNMMNVQLFDTNEGNDDGDDDVGRSSSGGDRQKQRRLELSQPVAAKTSIPVGSVSSGLPVCDTPAEAGRNRNVTSTTAAATLAAPAEQVVAGVDTFWASNICVDLSRAAMAAPHTASTDAQMSVESKTMAEEEGPSVAKLSRSVRVTECGNDNYRRRDDGSTDQVRGGAVQRGHSSHPVLMFCMVRQGCVQYGVIDSAQLNEPRRLRQRMATTVTSLPSRIRHSGTGVPGNSVPAAANAKTLNTSTLPTRTNTSSKICDCAIVRFSPHSGEYIAVCVPCLTTRRSDVDVDVMQEEDADLTTSKSESTINSSEQRAALSEKDQNMQCSPAAATASEYFDLMALAHDGTIDTECEDTVTYEYHVLLLRVHYDGSTPRATVHRPWTMWHAMPCAYATKQRPAGARLVYCGWWPPHSAGCMLCVWSNGLVQYVDMIRGVIVAHVYLLPHSGEDMDKVEEKFPCDDDALRCNILFCRAHSHRFGPRSTDTHVHHATALPLPLGSVASLHDGRGAAEVTTTSYKTRTTISPLPRATTKTLSPPCPAEAVACLPAPGLLAVTLEQNVVYTFTISFQWSHASSVLPSLHVGRVSGAFPRSDSSRLSLQLTPTMQSYCTEDIVVRDLALFQNFTCVLAVLLDSGAVLFLDTRTMSILTHQSLKRQGITSCGTASYTGREIFFSILARPMTVGVVDYNTITLLKP